MTGAATCEAVTCEVVRWVGTAVQVGFSLGAGGRLMMTGCGCGVGLVGGSSRSRSEVLGLRCLPRGRGVLRRAT